ncbi:hypothetical protein Rs2_50405 [Raphanus sativus]|nr:hypothetical protein Rs2_50405 [Raphanus sativus]
MVPPSSPSAVSKEASTVQIAHQDGVILSVDTRATKGPIVAENNCEQIHYSAPNTYSCGVGTAEYAFQAIKRYNNDCFIEVVVAEAKLMVAKGIGGPAGDCRALKCEHPELKPLLLRLMQESFPLLGGYKRGYKVIIELITRLGKSLTGKSAVL